MINAIDMTFTKGKKLPYYVNINNMIHNQKIYFSKLIRDFKEKHESFPGVVESHWKLHKIFNKIDIR